jgi:arabinogalactan oligomer/maltooligosaccharide transport system permease protein
MMGYYICKGFFDTISKSLDEAAMIDGASRNTIFWKIIMPLSKPIVIYTILTSFLGPWGDFMMANFLVARNDQSSWTVAVGMQNWLTPSNMPDYFTTFCAAGVVVSIVPTILFFFMQRFYVEGVTGGAVKG